MKKALVGLVMIAGLFGSTMAQSFTTVYDWMFENGLTNQTQENFRPSDNVTRGEISKFFAKFAEVQGLEKTKTESECQFNDIDGYDYTLVPTIIAACQYGLVKGHNGNYYPNNNLTEAEALTVVIRALVGIQDETGNPRWSEYWSYGQTLSIIDNEGVWDLDTDASRSKVGTWLYRAGNQSQDNIQEQLEEGAKELQDVLEDIFGQGFFDE